MNPQFVKNFVIGSAMLMFAALCFVATESRGKIIESRFGLIGTAGIAVLLVIAFFCSAEKTDKK